MEDFINQLYRSYEDNVDDDDQEEGVQEPAPKKAKYEEESQADTFAENKEKTMKQGKKKDAKVPEKTEKESSNVKVIIKRHKT